MGDNKPENKDISHDIYSDEFKKHLHDLIDKSDIKGLREALGSCDALIKTDA